jgi:hypothetical protein
VVAQQSGEVGTRKLCALIDVQDLWPAVTGDRLLDGGDARGAVVAFSDLPGASGSPRDFGYHSADVQVGVDRDFTLWQRRHLSTRVAWDLESTDARIGKRLGILRIRVKLRGPVYTIRQVDALEPTISESVTVPGARGGLRPVRVIRAEYR